MCASLHASHMRVICGIAMHMHMYTHSIRFAQPRKGQCRALLA